MRNYIQWLLQEEDTKAEGMIPTWEEGGVLQAAVVGEVAPDQIRPMERIRTRGGEGSAPCAEKPTREDGTSLGVPFVGTPASRRTGLALLGPEKPDHGDGGDRGCCAPLGGGNPGSSGRAGCPTV